MKSRTTRFPWILTLLVLPVLMGSQRCRVVVVPPSPPTISPGPSASALPSSQPSPSASPTIVPSPSAEPTAAPSAEPTQPPPTAPPTAPPTVAPPSAPPSTSPEQPDNDFPSCGGIPDHPVPSIYDGPCPPGANADFKDVRTSNTRPPETVTGYRICVAQTACKNLGPSGKPETCPSPYPENESQTCKTLGIHYFNWLADDNNGDGRPGTFAVLLPGQSYGYMRNREGQYGDAYGRWWVSLSDRHPVHEWIVDRTDVNHDHFFGLCSPLALRACTGPTPAPTATPPPTPRPSAPLPSPSPIPSTEPCAANGIKLGFRAANDKRNDCKECKGFRNSFDVTPLRDGAAVRPESGCGIPLIMKYGEIQGRIIESGGRESGFEHQGCSLADWEASGGKGCNEGDFYIFVDATNSDGDPDHWSGKTYLAGGPRTYCVTWPSVGYWRCQDGKIDDRGAAVGYGANDRGYDIPKSAGGGGAKALPKAAHRGFFAKLWHLLSYLWPFGDHGGW